nr:MAG: helix-turn-helix domain protein [Bacteriophage sp.]
MATQPFTATIGGKETTIYQNAYTGLFYTVLDDGRHTPIDYHLIRAQTTSMQRLKYWRNRYGYTQSELASRIHVSGKTIIMMWEAGLRHPGRKYRQLLNAELGYDIFFE